MGISVRTTNENFKAQTDIPQLWENFFKTNIIDSVPHKFSNDIYCVYTDYEGDFTEPYTVIIGCRVNIGGSVPKGMKAVTIEEGNYAAYTAHGKLSDGIVINTWNKIWSSTLERTYKTDYEFYSAQMFNPDETHVEVLIGVK